MSEFYDAISKSRSRRQSGLAFNQTFTPEGSFFSLTKEDAASIGAVRSEGYKPIPTEQGGGTDREFMTEVNLSDPTTELGKVWIENSKKLYELSKGESQQEQAAKFNTDPVPDMLFNPAKGRDLRPKSVKTFQENKVNKEPQTDQEFAQWGINHIGYINYNLSYLGVKATETVLSNDPETSLALYQMMNMYDELPNFTREGTIRAVKGLATDPLTYIGLATLGTAALGKKIVGGMTKVKLKKLLANNIKDKYGMDILLAIEGGSYMGADDIARQTIAVSAEEQEGIDAGQTGESIATGAVLGPVAGRALNVAGKGVSAATSKAKEIIKNRTEKSKETPDGS